ncbi:MAG: DUF378 domain-containing protein [Clostridia bacterium]|nr:DUF378 domain-containing protein [Clostridia bacterium]
MRRNWFDRIALIVVIIGAINWLLVGLFKYDLVAAVCGGPTTIAARIIYTIVGLFGLYTISLLFRDCDEI